MSAGRLRDLRGPLRAALAAAGVLIAALAGGMLVQHRPLVGLVVPGAAVAAIFFARWPALGISLLLLLSGTYGSIRAFTGFDIEALFDLLILGMLLAVLLARARGQSDRMPIWPGVAACALYLGLTFIAIPTSGSLEFGFESFRSTAWHMAIFPLLAVAGYSAAVYKRVGKALVGIAALVGAYATLRWIVGPAADEVLNANAWTTQWLTAADPSAQFDFFNHIGEKLQVIGSFPYRHHLGFWAATMTPFCLAMAVAYRGRWRLVAAAAALLCTIALFGSHVRIGIPGLAVGILAVLILSARARAFPRWRLGTTMALAATVVLIGGGVFATTVGSQSHQRASYRAILAPQGDTSFQVHEEKWSKLVKGIGQSPFGLGLGLAAQNPLDVQGTENVYLKVAYEQGVGMVVLFTVALIAVAVGLARRAVATSDRQAAGMGIGGAGALATALTMYLTADYASWLSVVPLWVVLGIAVGSLASERETPKVRRTDQKLARAPAPARAAISS